MAPATIAAAASNAFDQMSDSAQEAWNGATSDEANNNRIAAGAQSAGDLLSNGYDPDSTKDNQELITAIAGAISLVPGVGPLVGGALMLLDAIGEGIASLLQSTGLIWFGCRTSGNWTPANMLAIEQAQAQQFVAQQTPNVRNWFPTPTGSFASLVFPMLLGNAAKMSNCAGTFTNPQILAAAVAMWNANASGPAMSVYIPALTDGAGGQIFAGPQQAWLAFQPCPSMQHAETMQQPAGILGLPGVEFQSPFVYPGGEVVNAMSARIGRSELADAPNVFGPCVLKLSGSYFNPATKAQTVNTPFAASSPVTAGQVAIGAAAVVGTAAAGTAIYSFATGQAVGVVVGKAWKGIVGLFR